MTFFGVWHGSTAQLHHREELDALDQFCRLRQQGLLNRVAGVKPGLHLLNDAIDPLLLLNLPPKLERPLRREGLANAALIPLPVDWRKNFYTNLYAAGGVPRLRTLYVTSDFQERRAFKPRAHVLKVLSPSRSQLFRLIADSDVVCNATLSECQPMTALEALALGVPCVTGSLGLGALDEHPYQRLVQVQQVDSLSALREAIEKLLDLSEKQNPRSSGN